MESGVSEEHCIEILPLKKANAENNYSALVEYCRWRTAREKNIQLESLLEWDLMELLLSLVTTGVQGRLKELLPHALFVYCRCHVLQLASMQAANATPGINQVYTTLMTLWKFFHYSPKRADH